MPAGVPIRTYGVFSPEGADRLLAGSVARYRKDSRPYAETAAFFGDGLLTSQDERWHRQRRFVAPLFTPRRISGDYTPVLVQEAARMRATWAVAPDATADVHALSVAYCGPSAECCSAPGWTTSCLGSDRCCPSQRVPRARVSTASLIPRTWPTPTKRRGSAARRELYAIVDGLIERQRAAPDGGDLLGRLLHERDPSTGKPLSADEVRDQALIFLLAGHETTATALAFSLQFLGRQAACASPASSYREGRSGSAIRCRRCRSLSSLSSIGKMAVVERDHLEACHASQANHHAAVSRCGWPWQAAMRRCAGRRRSTTWRQHRPAGPRVGSRPTRRLP